MQQATSRFSSKGLEIHECELTADGGQVLGVELDGTALEARASLKRFWRIRFAIVDLLRRRRVTGYEVEVVLGHATFLSLARRELLSIFHTTYRFIRRHYYEKITLWSSARDEFRCYIGAMWFLRAPWSRPWSTEVYQVDASTYGWGISASSWTSSEVAAVGRVSERSRYRLGVGTAREHASGQAKFDEDFSRDFAGMGFDRH